MSDRLPAVDESSIQWEAHKSEKGVPFEVGRDKAESGKVPDKSAGGVAGVLDEQGEGPSQVAALFEDKDPFTIAVDWPVVGTYSSTAPWISTTDHVKKTAGITRYRLCKSTSVAFQYILEITNTESYNYRFRDESRDAYKIDTWVRSDHWVKYNSNNPKIVAIMGS